MPKKLRNPYILKITWPMCIILSLFIVLVILFTCKSPFIKIPSTSSTTDEENPLLKNSKPKDLTDTDTGADIVGDHSFELDP